MGWGEAFGVAGISENGIFFGKGARVGAGHVWVGRKLVVRQWK